MTGYEWVSGWWYRDVPKLIHETDILYKRLLDLGKPGKLDLTASRVMEHRQWDASISLEELKAALDKLGYFYVPKVFKPGPLFVFPQKNIDGDSLRAQTKPLYEIENSDGQSSKYRTCGIDRSEWLGPIWLGNDLETMKSAIETKSVILVEGAFDLLACRVACPSVPTMSPLTKRIGEDHQAYLKVLGIKNLYLMFDNDKPKNGSTMGAGEISARSLQKNIKWAKVHILKCPSHDPSDALKSIKSYNALRNTLNNYRSL